MKTKLYSLLLGILYVLISYGTSSIFFPNYISTSMLFFITILLIPSTSKLMISAKPKDMENPSKYTLRTFIKNHSKLIEIFFFVFAGIFIGYLLITVYNSNSSSYQINFLENQGIKGNFADVNIDRVAQFQNIFINNVSVILIAFVLSLFYGIGALFLTVLNASIFANFIIKASEIITKNKIAGISILTIHMIPEVYGFILASVAGAIVFGAERWKGGSLKDTIKDSSILLLLSITFIIIAALIEAFVTPSIIAPFL